MRIQAYALLEFLERDSLGIADADGEVAGIVFDGVDHFLWERRAVELSLAIEIIDNADQTADGILDDDARIRGELLSLVAEDGLPHVGYDGADIQRYAFLATAFHHKAAALRALGQQHLGERLAVVAEHMEDAKWKAFAVEQLFFDNGEQQRIERFVMVVKRAAVAMCLLGDHIHRDVLQVVFLKQFPECIFDAFYCSGCLLIFAGSCHVGFLRCGAIRVMARPLGRARFACVHDEHLQSVFDIGEADVRVEVEGQNLRVGI